MSESSFFCSCPSACGISVSWPGPWAVEAWSPNHWTYGEFPWIIFKMNPPAPSDAMWNRDKLTQFTDLWANNISLDFHFKSLSFGVLCYEAIDHWGNYIFLCLIFLLVLLKDIYLFIIWLHWVLVATLRGFSLIAMQWLLSLQSMVCRVHGLQYLWHTGSVALQYVGS